MLDFLREFLKVNSVLVWFVYGLVFFVLGLAIALRSRAHSQLELARQLNWLAAFGFLPGLKEWGDLFIPIQATYLPASTVDILYFVQSIILAASFAALFQFGAELLGDRLPALRFLPAFVSDCTHPSSRKYACAPGYCRRVGTLPDWFSGWTYCRHRFASSGTKTDPA